MHAHKIFKMVDNCHVTVIMYHTLCTLLVQIGQVESKKVRPSDMPLLEGKSLTTTAEDFHLCFASKKVWNVVVFR